MKICDLCEKPIEGPPAETGWMGAGTCTACVEQIRSPSFQAEQKAAYEAWKARRKAAEEAAENGSTP